MKVEFFCFRLILKFYNYIMKIIIIGGTAAGMTFASKLSRSKVKVEHVVYEKREYTSLGACGIPFFVGGKTKSSNDLIAVSVEKHIENGINVKVKHEVIKVDIKKKEVIVKDLKSGKEFIDNFDELMIATGATPIIPNLPGINLENVLSATTYEDALALKKIADDKNIKNIVIVGAGFIGIEMAENLLKYNKNITIIEKQEFPAAGAFDQDMTQPLIEEFQSHKIMFKPQESLQEIIGNKKVQKVKTDKGIYKADAVIVSVGFKPNTSLVKEQLDTYPNGGIKINKRGQTSVPHVWAAGDCVWIWNPVLKKDSFIPLATTSRKMATIAFENMVEKRNIDFNGSTGTSGFRFENFELFRTGITEQQAKDQNINYISVVINANDCASYSGEAKPLTLKVIAEKKTGAILGAQSYGTNRASSIRIAAFVPIVNQRMTTKDIEQLDFFYTPPFSGATDIIHIAARVLNKSIG